LVFQEGTRSYTGEIGRFHRGAFYYAEQLHLPIQPLLIEGMIDHIGKRQFMMRPSDVDLSILPTLQADDASMGRNYKRRAKSMEYYYSSLLHTHHQPIGILGAGVGGLFTGALLAKEGYPITIL
jgi:1-acyl-sn-glycerol-3-phosphate acyltransferase